MKKRLFLILLCLLLLNFVVAQEAKNAQDVELYFFYGQGCPHCAKAETFLDSIESDYPTLIIHRYETYFDEQGREKFVEMANSLNQNIEGVPTFFINGKMISGFSDSVKNELISEIESCLEACEVEKTPKESGFKQTITIPAVISAAIVDAINPCAFAVLIILLTTILVSNNKKRALFAGLAFSLSIFISYFLMGIGLYSAINAAGMTHTFYLVVAILALVIGLFNLKDYFWYGKWFVMEVPMSWRPKLKATLKKVTSVPGAFLTGFLVSLFLLPCTSGPYIVILGLLSRIATKNYALMLLILYNLIFILPMIIISFAVYFGVTTTEKAEGLRQKRLKHLHLIAGLIILALGIGMLVALAIGVI